jgi:hypothetical protein
MKFNLFFLASILVTFLFSCTLNSEQEASLNQNLSRYLKARNSCMKTGIIGFSHPDYVLEVKNESDSAFLKAFDCENYGKAVRFSDPTLRKTIKEKDIIHVYYELDVEAGNTGVVNRRSEGLYALSEDNGKTWYFLMKDIYENREISKSVKRLID